MDYSRKANGAAKDTAEVYTAFIKECAEKGIELDSSDKRTINVQLRSLSKKHGKQFFELNFTELAQELSAQVSPLFNYLNALSGASFLADIQDMGDAAEDVNASDKGSEDIVEDVSHSDESADDGVSAGNESGYIDISPAETVSGDEKPISEVAPKEEEPVEAAEEESGVSSDPERKKAAPSDEKMGAAQAKTLDALSRIRGMRGGKVVDTARKKEIAREINSLKVQRDTRTRNISMKAEDMAVLTSILEYAGTKEGKEKNFLDCDMSKWSGIFHAAMDCLIEKLVEENRHGYLNAIANGQVKLEKKQAEIDEKINKLLAEKDGF